MGGKTNYRLVNTIHAGYHEGDEVGVQQMQSQIGVQLYQKCRPLSVARLRGLVGSNVGREHARWWVDKDGCCSFALFSDGGKPPKLSAPSRRVRGVGGIAGGGLRVGCCRGLIAMRCCKRS